MTKDDSGRYSDDDDEEAGGVLDVLLGGMYSFVPPATSTVCMHATSIVRTSSLPAATMRSEVLPNAKMSPEVVFSFLHVPAPASAARALLAGASEDDYDPEEDAISQEDNSLPGRNDVSKTGEGDEGKTGLVRERSNDSAEKRERRERRLSVRSGGYQFAEGDWQCPKEGYVDMR